jgi:hypothetical protein
LAHLRLYSFICSHVLAHIPKSDRGEKVRRPVKPLHLVGPCPVARIYGGKGSPIVNRENGPYAEFFVKKLLMTEASRTASSYPIKT